MLLESKPYMIPTFWFFMHLFTFRIEHAIADISKPWRATPTVQESMILGTSNGKIVFYAYSAYYA